MSYAAFRATAWARALARNLIDTAVGILPGPAFRLAAYVNAIRFADLEASTIERANVTPAAFTACKSIGVSSQGRFRSRACSGVLAKIASRNPSGSPAPDLTIPGASSRSHRSRIVGA